ncbi:MAG: hypothetical protein FJW35_18980, partial [Acidobacteria bacterium]|nr:hypothetical protein [Acidobacteriota bacterium]
MKRSRFSPLALSFILLLWIVPPHTRSQDTPQEQEKKFFDVSLGPDDIYRYSNLKFSGDYTSFESPSGMLALGRTEAGVTVVIVLGGGTLHIECPDALQDKLKGAFGSYPLVTGFQTLYLRLHPKEFDEAFGGIQMTKVADTQAMAMAQA